MRERPILFSGPMVRAILAGAKTQTRRVVRAQPVAVAEPYGNPVHRCPYGGRGDRLWVRETFARDTATIYAADLQRRPDGVKFTPSIFMRREESRLTLQVEAVRLEHLHDILVEDILAEGIAADKWSRGAIVEHGIDEATAKQLRGLWHRGWNTINGERSGRAWEDNPLVWVICFRRLP